jgi:hypothetical protein
MKALALPFALLVTLANSAGTTLIQVDRTNAVENKKVERSTSLPTAHQIATWKATAVTTDYIPPSPPR